MFDSDNRYLKIKSCKSVNKEIIKQLKEKFIEFRKSDKKFKTFLFELLRLQHIVTKIGSDYALAAYEQLLKLTKDEDILNQPTEKELNKVFEFVKIETDEFLLEKHKHTVCQSQKNVSKEFISKLNFECDDKVKIENLIKNKTVEELRILVYSYVLGRTTQDLSILITWSLKNFEVIKLGIIDLDTKDFNKLKYWVQRREEYSKAVFEYFKDK